MMNDPKISVIMPVYKVEKYIKKAIQSILNQTFHDFELLAVDDGSPDKSGQICDQIAVKDHRVKVIHKENGGAPSARNAAMDLARGKYFYFMDSDDWAEPTMLEDMFALAEEHAAQCVVTGFFIDTYYNDTQYIELNIFEPDAVYLDKGSFRKAAYKLFDNNLLYTPWNKLFLAEYLRDNHIQFPKMIWDDFPFNLSVFRDIERVIVSSKRYYHFIRARAESETSKYVPTMYEKRETEHQWMLELYQYWGIDDEYSREFLARRYVERLIGCIENVTNRKCMLPRKEKKQIIKKMISDPKAYENVRIAKPRTFMMKTMLAPIRWKWGWLTYLESRIITRVKTGNIKLFATLKARR